MEIVNLLLYFALSLTRTTSSMPIGRINHYVNEMLNNFNYNEDIFDKRHDVTIQPYQPNSNYDKIISDILPELLIGNPEIMAEYIKTTTDSNYFNAHNHVVPKSQNHDLSNIANELTTSSQIDKQSNRLPQQETSTVDLESPQDSDQIVTVEGRKEHPVLLWRTTKRKGHTLEKDMNDLTVTDNLIITDVTKETSLTTDESTTEHSTTIERKTTESTTEPSTSAKIMMEFVPYFGTTEISTTEPSKTDPSTTDSNKTEPSKTDPSTTDPSKTEPSKTEPSMTEPSTTYPSTMEPSTTKPSTTEPSTKELSTTELSTTAKIKIEASTTAKSTTESSTTETNTIEPYTKKQCKTETCTTEPCKIKTCMTEPYTTELCTTKPCKTESCTTEPCKTEICTTEPCTSPKKMTVATKATTNLLKAIITTRLNMRPSCRDNLLSKYILMIGKTPLAKDQDCKYTTRKYLIVYDEHGMMQKNSKTMRPKKPREEYIPKSKLRT